MELLTEVHIEILEDEVCQDGAIEALCDICPNDPEGSLMQFELQYDFKEKAFDYSPENIRADIKPKLVQFLTETIQFPLGDGPKFITTLMEVFKP